MKATIVRAGGESPVHEDFPQRAPCSKEYGIRVTALAAMPKAWVLAGFCIATRRTFLSQIENAWSRTDSASRTVSMASA